jgi:hypothetical protein
MLFIGRAQEYFYLFWLVPLLKLLKCLGIHIGELQGVYKVSHMNTIISK